MKYLRKVFEEWKPKLINDQDDDIIKLNDVIEDTMISTDPSINLEFCKDHFLDEEFTTSVKFSIYSKKDLKKVISQGNPYSQNLSLDSSQIIQKNTERIEDINRFILDIKSLLFRLDKMGYIINYYSFDLSTVIIGFPIENEKLVTKK